METLPAETVPRLAVTPPAREEVPVSLPSATNILAAPAPEPAQSRPLPSAAMPPEAHRIPVATPTLVEPTSAPTMMREARPVAPAATQVPIEERPTPTTLAPPSVQPPAPSQSQPTPSNSGPTSPTPAIVREPVPSPRPLPTAPVASDRGQTLDLPLSRPVMPASSPTEDASASMVTLPPRPLHVNAVPPPADDESKSP